jgi:hypothetical protein
MSKKSRVQPKPVSLKAAKQTFKPAQAKSVIPALSLFVRIEKFLTLHLKKIFWISFGLTLVSGLLLFDIRVSTSGDDSGYIMRADDFIRHFIYPGFQGPLYPIILSPFIGIFGIWVVLLKLVSLLFMLGFVWLTYRAFKHRIPSLLVTFLLFFVSVNSYILYYASQTYSEAFFMFLSALTFSYFFKYFIDDTKEQPLKAEIRHQATLVLCILCMGLTRSIGYSAFLAVSAYFILQRHRKHLLYFVVTFLVILTIFQGFKYLVWGNPDFQFNEQGTSLMNKDFYNPGLGREDLPGYLNRLIKNSNNYLSGSFYAVIGFSKENKTSAVHPVVTVLTYLLLISGIIMTFRKNKYLLFTGVYVLIFLENTFFLLQTKWWQTRLIIPYTPLILILLMAALYFILNMKQFRLFQWAFPVFLIFLLILSVIDTVPRVIAVRQVEDKYSGLPRDWWNYCKISEWAAANLPPEALVACRKPSISSVYGNGKRFFGITQLKSFPGKSILQLWGKKGADLYVIPAYSMRQTFREDMSNALRNNIVAYGSNIYGKSRNEILRFFILNFSDSLKDKTFEKLKSYNINPTNNIDSVKVYLNNPNEHISIIYPDTLLNILMNAKVTHVLEASLLAGQPESTENVINTVENFMKYIRIKYPLIVTKIFQIGGKDEEPASIYKLNYEVYGLMTGRSK